jgi:hypothetical protein
LHGYRLCRNHFCPALLPLRLQRQMNLSARFRACSASVSWAPSSPHPDRSLETRTLA